MSDSIGSTEPNEPPHPPGSRPHRDRVRIFHDMLKEGQTAAIAIDNTPEHRAFYSYEIGKYPRLHVEFQGQLTPDVWIIKVRKLPPMN